MREIEIVISLIVTWNIFVTIALWKEIEGCVSATGELLCNIATYPLRRRKREQELELIWTEMIEEQKEQLIQDAMAEVKILMGNYPVEESEKTKDKKEVKQEWQEHIMERFMRMD